MVHFQSVEDNQQELQILSLQRIVKQTSHIYFWLRHLIHFQPEIWQLRNSHNMLPKVVGCHHIDLEHLHLHLLEEWITIDLEISDWMNYLTSFEIEWWWAYKFGPMFDKKKLFKLDLNENFQKLKTHSIEKIYPGLLIFTCITCVLG